MNKSSTKVLANVNILSLVGPVFVILSVLLLVIKESPFYVDLSATALVGLALCSRWKKLGLIAASGLLTSVLAYDFLLDGEPFSLWDLGLGVSIEIAFLATALASQELIEAYHSLQEIGEKALADFTAFQGEVKETLREASVAVTEKEELERLHLLAMDEARSNNDSKALFQRLLAMAKGELIEEIQKRESFQSKFYEEKQKTNLLEQKLEDAEILRKEISFLHIEKGRLQERFEGYSETSQIEITALNEKLEALIDRLKDLQSEKDELKEGLEKALKREIIEEDAKAQPSHLYVQLRSQFEEQKMILADTRKELFLKNEELLCMKKEQEEEALYDSKGAQKTYIDEIVSLQTRLFNAELEIEILKNLWDCEEIN